MIQKTLTIPDNFDFFHYKIRVKAVFHTGRPAATKNFLPVECDEDAWLEIKQIHIDNMLVSIDKAAEWCGKTVEELECIIADAYKNDYDDLPF